MKFNELEIHPDLIRAALDAGFDNLTPIQEQCLEPALKGSDIAGAAQTGTGKTVAFLLPVLHRIYTEELAGPAALIVTPTRELCVQIKEEAEKLTKHRPIGITSVYGGEGYSRQEEELEKNPELIVATPGRLIDYLKQNKIETTRLKFLVLDEADRMFDMGFIRDVRYIMKYAPTDTQMMLFSATLSYYVMRLASDYMKDPVEVKIESETVAVDRIDQKLLHLGREEKMPYLTNTILNTDGMKGIVFTNTRSMVQRIVNQLNKYGIHATGISSLLDQKKRIRLLKDFKLGKYSVLVATDVASRGLDIDDITHVFNYDLPQDAESYVHRIGRTARAGRSGVSISYSSEDDYDYLPRIERYLGNRIPVGEINSNYLKFPEGEFTPFTIPGKEKQSDEERPPRRNKQNRSDSRSRRGKKSGRPQQPQQPQQRDHKKPEKETEKETAESGELSVREMDRAAIFSGENTRAVGGTQRNNRGSGGNRTRNEEYPSSKKRRSGNSRNRNRDRRKDGEREQDGRRSDSRRRSSSHQDRRRTAAPVEPPKKTVVGKILSIFGIKKK